MTETESRRVKIGITGLIVGGSVIMLSGALWGMWLDAPALSFPFALVIGGLCMVFVGSLLEVACLQSVFAS